MFSPSRLCARFGLFYISRDGHYIYTYSSSSLYDDDSDGNDSVDYSPTKSGSVKIPAESETFIAKDPTKETPAWENIWWMYLKIWTLKTGI